MRRCKWWFLILTVLWLLPAPAFAEEKWEWILDQWDAEATVGKMAGYQGKILVNGKQPDEPLKIVITAVSKESGTEIFQAETISKEGEFQYQIQFFDGSPHQVRLEAFRPGSETPMTVTQTAVDVTGIAPPGHVQIKTMVFLLLVTSAGMLAGVGVVKWKEKRQRGSLHANVT